MDKRFYVYIMTNKYNTVLYTGVTNDLDRRVFEHKHKLAKGFTKKYNIEKLVYLDRKSTRLNSSHVSESRMPSSA